MDLVGCAAGDHHVHPCCVSLRVHHAHVCRVHGPGVARRIIGRPCLLDGGGDSRRACALGNVISKFVVAVSVGVPGTRSRM